MKPTKSVALDAQIDDGAGARRGPLKRPEPIDRDGKRGGAGKEGPEFIAEGSERDVLGSGVSAPTGSGNVAGVEPLRHQRMSLANPIETREFRVEIGGYPVDRGWQRDVEAEHRLRSDR